MKIGLTTAVVCLFTPVWALAGVLEGSVTDSSGAPVRGAQVGLYSRVGLTAESVSDGHGAFRFEAAADDATKLVITAQGFATRSVPLPAASPMRVALDIAPVSDSVRVVGSRIDAPAAEQPSSITVITGEEIRDRNDAIVTDLLRTVPGVVMLQSGVSQGGLTTMSIRGGDTNYQLVEIDGMPVNSFDFGGLFDFSQIPTELLDHIEIVRGAQSALYGSYANSGVVNFVTRSGAGEPAFDIVAEGGSHDEYRGGISGSGMLAGWGLAGSVQRGGANGEVANDDFLNQGVMLHLNRNWDRQSFSASGFFNNSQVGDPGPYGSDPLGLYGGLDLISRDKDNNSEYNFHYQADLTPRLRGELFGGFFLGNDFYASPYGNSFNKDIRGQAEARVTASVTPWWTTAAGVAWDREEVKNTYITDETLRAFPLRRDEEGIYWENRLRFRRLYIQVGVRGEIFNTPFIPSCMDVACDDISGANRPDIPAHTNASVNPKIAASYSFSSGTQLHASFGTGIRPPGGSELAFTDNPDLKPERTLSVDAGVSQKLFHDHLVLNGTFFDNWYRDLIVGLGGDLADLSAYTTANLSNARARGLEASAEVRPARWMLLTAAYMYLDTAVLALNDTDLPETYFTVGQQLPRRPPQSGSFRLNLARGRFSGDLIGFVRGSDLDVEPNYGVSEGFFNNPGYANLEVNLNIRVAAGLTAYGTLRNALDEHYEEIFGFPSPRLNFVAGLKWSLRGRDF
jgi:outer membrane receptor protein involved in Fe transport